MKEVVSLIQLGKHSDSDGTLVCGELPDSLPFEVERFFYIVDVPNNGCRGNHACRNARFLISVLKGKVVLEIDDTVHQELFELNEYGDAVYIPPMVWFTVRFQSDDAILLVLSDQLYKDARYINEYSEYVKEKGD